MLNPKLKKNKLKYEGKEFKNNEGFLFKVLEYINSDHVKIQFKDTGYKTKTTIASVREGKIKDPLSKSVCDIGYIGIGKYNVRDHRDIYFLWSGTIRRIYIDKYPGHPTSMCDEWLNFQNFAKWYEENIYDYNEEKLIFSLALARGKIASPDNVAFVPLSFLGLFSLSNKKESNLPRGVFYNKRKRKYFSSITFNKKQMHLGYYDDIEITHSVYQNKRKELYEELVESYKGKIPDKVYNLLSSIDINEYE